MQYHTTYLTLTFLVFLFMPWSLLGRLLTSLLKMMAEVPHFVSRIAFHLTSAAIALIFGGVIAGLIMWALAVVSALLVNLGWF